MRPVVASTSLLLPSYVPYPCPTRTQSFPPLPCSCLDVCPAIDPHISSYYLHFPVLALVCALLLSNVYRVISPTSLLLPSYAPCHCPTFTLSLPLLPCPCPKCVLPLPPLPCSCLHICPALVPRVPSYYLYSPALAFICALSLSHTYPVVAPTSLLLPSYVPCPCSKCVLPLPPLPCSCLRMCPGLVLHVPSHCPTSLLLP